MSDKRPLIMIGLDAGEPRLIEQWTEDGTLPNLAALRQRGAYSRLQSSADWLVGSPWPTFYTSSTPADHGFYHYLPWRADKMRAVRPDSHYLPLQPFWRNMQGVRTVALDVPLTYEAQPFNGVEISGWSTHETLVPPYAHPRSVMDWIRKDFGASARDDEFYKICEPEELIAVRDTQLGFTKRVGDLARALIRREQWQYFLAVFTSTHRCGHKLWDTTGMEGEADVRQQRAVKGALKEIYAACDKTIGDIIKAAPKESNIIIFSLHGMGENTCRTELMPDMLDRIFHGRPPEDAPAEKKGLASKLRGLVPENLRHAVKTRLPLSLQDKLTAFWRIGNIDFSDTKAFAVVADLQGYIRINLKGREAQGIVEPGQEMDAVCNQIEAGLRSFRDADTGEPLIHDVIRTDALYPQGGDKMHHLPDLLVKWSFTPCARHRAIVSDELGEIPWPTPGKNFTGRAGNHRPEGFFLGHGPGIQNLSDMTDANILDLAPTVHALLGQDVPAAMQGKPLPCVH